MGDRMTTKTGNWLKAVLMFAVCAAFVLCGKQEKTEAASPYAKLEFNLNTYNGMEKSDRIKYGKYYYWVEWTKDSNYISHFNYMVATSKTGKGSEVFSAEENNPGYFYTNGTYIIFAARDYTEGYTYNSVIYRCGMTGKNKTAVATWKPKSLGTPGLYSSGVVDIRILTVYGNKAYVYARQEIQKESGSYGTIAAVDVTKKGSSKTIVEAASGVSNLNYIYESNIRYVGQYFYYKIYGSSGEGIGYAYNCKTGKKTRLPDYDFICLQNGKAFLTKQKGDTVVFYQADPLWSNPTKIVQASNVAYVETIISGDRMYCDICDKDYNDTFCIFNIKTKKKTTISREKYDSGVETARYGLFGDDSGSNDNGSEQESGETTDLSKAKVTLSKTSYSYDGKNKSPSVTVMLGGKTISRSNYTLEYKNNKNVGTASVTVKGKGSYKGSQTVKYTITSPGTVNVKFDPCSGNVSKKTKKVSIGKKYGALPVPTRKGYKFRGWYASNMNKSLVADVSPVTAASYVKNKKSHTLFALWGGNTVSVSAKINNRHKVTGSYCDDWFLADSRNSQKLKQISALAAASTYGGSSSPQNLLKACGFDKNTVMRYFTGPGSASTKKDNDHCTVYTGSKYILTKSGETQKLIAIIISGYSGDDYEWISNFNLGTGNYHAGFKAAADEALEFIKSKYKDIGKSRVWICGHSRGAAITNLVATSLLSQSKAPEVYAYGFATPNTTDKSYLETGSKFNSSIINIVNDGDFVPEVPPSRQNWNYGKNGKTITFSVNTKIGNLYKEYTGKKYKGMTKEERGKLIDAFCKAGKSKTDYSKNNYGNISTGKYSARDYCQKGLALAMNAKKTVVAKGADAMIAYAKPAPALATLNSKLIMKSTINPEIPGAHHMETYLAYVNSLAK